MTPMCRDKPLQEGYRCPRCGGTNIRGTKKAYWWQCCSGYFNGEWLDGCGYVGRKEEFRVIRQSKL